MRNLCEPSPHSTLTAEKGTGSNTDATSSSALTYDSLSRVNEECQSIAEGSGRSVSYGYDP